MELIVEVRLRVDCEDRELTPEQVFNDLSYNFDVNTIAATIVDAELEDFEIVAGRSQ